MFKNVSYNQLKLIRFIACIVLLVAYMMLFFLTDYAPQLLKDIADYFLILALAVHLFTLTFYIYKTTRGDVLQDEMSRDNNKKSALFTLTIVTCVLCILTIITIFFEITLTINNAVCFCAFVAIQATDDGYYLHLERKVASNAGADDED